MATEKQRRFNRCLRQTLWVSFTNHADDADVRVFGPYRSVIFDARGVQVVGDILQEGEAFHLALRNAQGRWEVHDGLDDAAQFDLVVVNDLADDPGAP
jgi:hypothetical protein